MNSAHCSEQVFGQFAIWMAALSSRNITKDFELLLHSQAQKRKYMILRRIFILNEWEPWFDDHLSVGSEWMENDPNISSIGQSQPFILWPANGFSNLQDFWG